MRGVLSLLLARCVNPSVSSSRLMAEAPWEADEGGATPAQVALVEQIELISVAQDMHQTVVSLPKELHTVLLNNKTTIFKRLSLICCCNPIVDTRTTIFPTRPVGFYLRAATSLLYWAETCFLQRLQSDSRTSGLKRLKLVREYSVKSSKGKNKTVIF